MKQQAAPETGCKQKLSIGYSPCPNDTFIFCGLAHGKISTPLVFEEPLLEDVETLNRWALQKELDVTKLSYHALGHVLEEYCVLKTGSALGRGCGPLLIAKEPVALTDFTKIKIAIPGEFTTAALLFHMFLPGCRNIEIMRFDYIMDAIVTGRVQAGVIIHESRFTYEQHGLHCLQDLGQWWEDVSGQPVPLGCIAARRSLGKECIEEIDRVIGASIDMAYDKPADCLGYIRANAQEMDQQVMEEHIGLYVNSFSRNLRSEGQKAVLSFLEKGRNSGVLPSSDLDVFSP